MNTVEKLRSVIPSKELAARKKNDRALFLSPFMRKLSGSFGKKVVAAFVGGDKDEFKRLWDQVGSHLVNQMGSETASNDSAPSIVRSLRELSFALEEKAALKEVFALLQKSLSTETAAVGEGIDLYLVHVPSCEIIAGPLKNDQSQIWDIIRKVISDEELKDFRVTDRPESVKAGAC